MSYLSVLTSSLKVLKVPEQSNLWYQKGLLVSTTCLQGLMKDGRAREDICCFAESRGWGVCT